MGCPHDRQPGQSQGQWPPVPSPPRNVVYLPAPYPWLRVPYTYSVPLPAPAPAPAPMAGPSTRPPRDALHPCIDARGVPLLFDARECPRRALPEHARFAGWSVFPEPVRDLRLVARAFPWPIEIRNEVVVCSTVWERVYASLRTPVTEAEWALVCADPARKRTVERAMRRRIERDADPVEQVVPLRIDYLGDETMFMGLEKDEDFVESVLLPGKRKVETFVIKMGRR
ncbi:hypothetical protein PsYK624_088920 [Phanerochaete sordida]|uniref:DUF6699 domain-containing protein n=1 Tax=Phanerochaete sordida TaxID=48140 RepID=A0A9P3GD66_9APHY|nr:hypothetical protein PsYK624_088920 [Phanerochaete sordida]